MICITAIAPRSIETIIKELIDSSERLNKQYEAVIETCSFIAGCDLSDWELEYIDAYIELALEEGKRLNDRKD